VGWSNKKKSRQRKFSNTSLEQTPGSHTPAKNAKYQRQQPAARNGNCKSKTLLLD